MYTNEYLSNAFANLVEEYDYSYANFAIRKILDEWNTVKSPLLNAFALHPNYIPEQFCIAFDQDYERVINTHASNYFSGFLNGCMERYVDDIPEEIKSRREYSYQWLPDDLYAFLTSLSRYAFRTISEDTCELLNRIIPEIHPHAGEKTSRVINRICTYLGYNKHPDYNKEFAKYADSLSPMIIKRHTILSLNPLDYLTMSFGNSWASCHTIDKHNKRGMPNNYEGVYSSGTISYMLDPSSFIFYTVDASYDGTEYWNQPKINRQMFHFGEHKLVQGRLYPQDNDSNTNEYTTYRQIVQQVIAQCFNMPNLWTVSKGTDNASRYIISRGTHYKDYTNYDNCTLSRNKEYPNENNFLVGAAPICIECGYTHSTEDCINCCNNPAGGLCCDDCGCELDEDDAFYIDGTAYCRDCVNWCEWCEEYHRGEEYFIEGRDIYVCESCFYEDFATCDHCGDNYEKDDMTEATNEHGRAVYVCKYCLERYYEECTECGEYHWRDNMTVNGDGQWVCKECLEDKYIKCEDCDEYYLKEDAHKISNDEIYLCESCYKDRTSEAV